jgi:flagellin
MRPGAILRCRRQEQTMTVAGVVNTNVDALFALNALTNTANTTSTLEQQLSSGLAINSPADNPAGYIAAQGFQTQIGGTQQAESNVNQAISLVQTADGAVSTQINILESISNIANGAANGTNDAQQLQSDQAVVSQLQTQVSTIAQQTNFNGQNLLDGSFNGIQFQVGASEGQIIGLSLGSTEANQLGVNQSSADPAGLYATDGSASGGVGDTTGNSYAITTGGVGAFTAGTIAIAGTAGSANATVSAATESAEDIAASINGLQSSTGVTATADTSVAFNVTAGSISFTLGNGDDGAGDQTNAVNIASTVSSVSNSGLQPLVSAINEETGTTGITASVNSNNQLVLTQGQGDNISLTNFAGTGTLAAGGTAQVTLAAGGTTSATVQGLVTVQSNEAFALSSGNEDIGLLSNSSLSTLSGVNVSTISGANSAMNVVSFALQQLENTGAQLGALQQRLQASASNLQTTDTNLTSAQSVVQDASLPQVTTQLNQQEILQQAGISALSQSQSLQQTYLKLLQ